MPSTRKKPPAETEGQRIRRERAERRARMAKKQASASPAARRVYGLPDDVALERRREQGRRTAEARRRAFDVMAARRPEEYGELYAAELAGVNRERGPLPGDEAAS